MTNLNLRRFAAPADHSFGGAPDKSCVVNGMKVIGVSAEEMEKTSASLEISDDQELVAQHPAGTEFAVTLFTENGIVGACELVAEFGQNTDLVGLVQGVTPAGEFTLKGEYKAVVEALDAIYCIAWNKGSDDTNSLHILDCKGARQMWWTVLEEAGADPYNPGLKGQEKAVAPLFQQVQD